MHCVQCHSLFHFFSNATYICFFLKNTLFATQVLLKRKMKLIVQLVFISIILFTTPTGKMWVLVLEGHNCMVQKPMSLLEVLATPTPDTALKYSYTYFWA